MSRNSMDLFEIMEEILKFKDELISIKEDMLKMIEAIERNEMHIKQLNWKMNNYIGHNPDRWASYQKSELTNKKGDTK